MSGKVGVVFFPGSCDERDAFEAIERSGARAEFLWHAERDLRGVDAIVLPGGFSYGDYLRPGALARFSPVMEEVAKFARNGGPVLGICNGFQVLCEAGLLPGALLPNVSLHFVCRQVRVAVENTNSLFTAACEPGEVLSIPVKHTTGRYFAPPALLNEIEEEGRVLLRYADGENPNGSARDIAGIASAAGNVFGLMPHPEHAVDPLTGSSDGLRIFEALAHAALAPA
jgi:phosphoribosylformylglycinamidine synthase